MLAFAALAPLGCAQQSVRLAALDHRVITVVDTPAALPITLSGLTTRQRSLALTSDDRSTFHTIVSDPIARPDGFQHALVSFNADLPEHDGVLVELRVSPDLTGDLWSPWLTLARWGRTDRFPVPLRAFTLPGGQAGVIDIDYFSAARASVFRRVQYRLLATSSAVRVGLVAVALENTRTWTYRSTDRSSTHATDLNIPFRTQTTLDPDRAGQLCSPTSVTMVLAHHGFDLPVNAVADIARDPDFDIFGNWPRNIQAAATIGVPGILTRIEHWSQVDALFAQGVPVIASIKAAAGELPGAPYKTTDGHLLVLTGFDQLGDVRVNDPAGGTESEGRRIYRRRDLTNAWLSRTGGTAYILFPRAANGNAAPSTGSSSSLNSTHSGL